jgi:hypothetical protein
MARAVSIALNELGKILRADDGVAAACAALTELSELSMPPITGAEIFDLHAAPELTERSASVKYPVMYVYCERLVNSLKEKFRTFSGTAELTAEIRVSHDHIDELQQRLQTYVDALTDVLDKKRGAWGETVFFTGGYEVLFGPVKRGGRNYLQTARVRFEVHVSVG